MKIIKNFELYISIDNRRLMLIYGIIDTYWKK